MQPNIWIKCKIQNEMNFHLSYIIREFRDENYKMCVTCAIVHVPNTYEIWNMEYIYSLLLFNKYYIDDYTETNFVFDRK